MLHFSDAVESEGVCETRLFEAIMEQARSGRRIKVGDLPASADRLPPLHRPNRLWSASSHSRLCVTSKRGADR